MNSDTPKTDGKLGLAGYFGDKDQVVEANFCRQLERELACSKRNEACCHCGSLMSQHSMGDGHSPVPMPEECPYAYQLSACHEQFSRIYKTLPPRAGGYSGEECVNEFFALKTSSLTRIEKLEGALRNVISVCEKAPPVDFIKYLGEAVVIAKSVLNPEETKGGGSP